MSQLTTMLILSFTTLLVVPLLCQAQHCSVTNGYVCVSSSSYVQCINTQIDLSMYSYHCSANTLCYGSGATVSEICFDTPCFVNGNLSLPRAPSNVYYLCVNGIAESIAECLNGPFNPVTGMCDSTGIISSLPPTCDGKSMYLADPSSCRHFFWCEAKNDEPAIRRECPPKMGFDTKYKLCRTKCAAVCGNRP